MIAAEWPFISIDNEGRALIEGTRIKVLEIAADHVAYQWDAEQIHRQHPHLSLPRIHAALGYYHEHEEECNRQMAEDEQRANEVCEAVENRSLLAKLRSHRRS